MLLNSKVAQILPKHGCEVHEHGLVQTVVTFVLLLLWLRSSLGAEQHSSCFLKCFLKLLLIRYRANGFTQELVKAKMRAHTLAMKWPSDVSTWS